MKIQFHYSVFQKAIRAFLRFLGLRQWNFIEQQTKEEHQTPITAEDKALNNGSSSSRTRTIIMSRAATPVRPPIGSGGGGQTN